MNKDEYFCTPIYHEEKPDWVSEINHICDPYIKNAELSELIYQSDLLLGDSRLKFFHDYIMTKTRWMLGDMGYDIDLYNLTYTDSWAQQFLSGGAYHYFHNHPNTHVSALFFLKCSEQTPKPMFQDPRPKHLALKLKDKDISKISNVNEFIYFDIYPGTLILHPSYLTHGFTVDKGLEKFRFIHLNIKAVERQT